MDTARLDVFEPFGGAPGATPVLGEVADRGRAHPAMYAPACWTVPSHAALLGGGSHRSMGLDHTGGAGPDEFRAGMQTNADRLLPEVLSRAGWATHGVSVNAWISPSSGFDTGFESWQQVEHDRVDRLGSSSRRDTLWWYLSALRGQLDDGAAAVAGLLSRWLDERDGRPFFWFVNLVECHSPYLPPKPWNPAGPIGRLRAAHDARVHQTFEQYWRACLAGWDASVETRERVRVQYLASISVLDDWVGRLFSLLDAAGVLDETIVVVTSDHGENLGENDLFGHAFSLDDRLLRVPFFERGPAELDLPAVAQLQDIPAAVAGAVGLDEHPWQERRADGVAVAELDAPGRRGEARTERAIREWSLGPEAAARLCRSFSVATDGRWKLLRSGVDGSEQLIDLEADPLETAPVGATATGVPAPTLGRLRGALDDAALAAIPRIQPQGSTDGDSTDPTDRAALERRLRGLGYL